VTVELRALLDLFYDEAAEHLLDLQTVLWSLSPVAPDPDGLELMVRSARSAKVSSITLGLADVTALVHQFERLLDRVQHGQVALTPQVRDVGLQACVVLRALLSAHRGSGSVETARAEDVCQRLQALDGGGGTGASPPARPAPRASEAGDAAVLPVGWREQSQRQVLRAPDTLRPTDRFQAIETSAREPVARRQERQGRGGAAARKKG
jgi:two-component system, chemotaxis family, sensor kinase CheA